MLANNQRSEGPWYKDGVEILEKVAWQTRAAWKFVASFLKKEWKIEDYPIRFTFDAIRKTSNASRLKPLPWTARVIHWPAMSGSGYTRLEAFGALHKQFEQFKAKEKKLPRPGTKVPVQFAATKRVAQYPELAKEFFQEILEVDGAWISDESSLWDFHSEETNEQLIEKIRQVYGVDVSDISTGNLADIFGRIAKSGAPKVPTPR